MFEPDPEMEARRQGMIDELSGKMPRSWPQGRISGGDDGQTHMAIAADLKAKIVRIQFTKPMDWLGLDPFSARQLAKMLIEKANQIELS